MVRTALNSPPASVLEEAKTDLYDKIVATSAGDYEGPEFRAEALRFCLGQMTCPMAVEFLQRASEWLKAKHVESSILLALHDLRNQIEGNSLARPKESFYSILLTEFIHRAQRAGHSPGPLIDTLLEAAISVMPKISNLRAIEKAYVEFLDSMHPSR